MKSVLGIIDQDVTYVSMLGENLNRRNSFPFEISTFERLESLIKAINRKSVAVILASETILAELISAIGDKWISDVKLIVLDEGIGDVSEFSHTWKYQSSEKIRKDILSILSDDSEVVINTYREGAGTSHVIGVYSLTNEVWGSAGTVMLAKLLSAKGGVLIVSMKELSGITYYLKRNNEDKDITDLIYYLRNGADRFRVLYESMVSHIEDINYISPSDSISDLKAVSEDDWITLLRELSKADTYSYILVEMSGSVNGFFNIQKECEKIVVFNSSNPVAEMMFSNYCNFLKENDHEDLISKIDVADIVNESDVPRSIQDFGRNEMWQELAKLVHRL